MFRALRKYLAFVPASRVVPLSLAAGAVCSVLLGIGIAEAVPGPSDIMPLAAVKPGMKGYGLTVFSGTTAEKFEVEIISTLHKFRPNQDLILVKTPNHPRLNVARTVAGMSGSPIYLGGKMIGAYAYGWLFGAEAIAGVTPIQSMLDELARPLPKGIAPLPGAPLLPSSDAGPGRPKPVRGALGYSGPPEEYDLAAHAKQLAARAAPMLAAPEGTPLARASTPVLLGGLSGTALKMAGDLLGPMGLDPVQAGGASNAPEPDAPARFTDGGAIGVQLVRGDMSAMGLGTVTRVSGDRLLAFGHPMMNGGVLNLPTAVARVHWILASQNRSFKIGEAVRPLGALVNDRQAAIVVDMAAKAPTFPMVVRIDGVPGAPHPVWNVEVAHDQFLSPSFAAMALGSAVETTTAERREMTWRATSKLTLAKYGTVTLTDFGTGSGSPVGPEDFIRARLVRAMGLLLNNRWEPVTVERVETKLDVSYAREELALRGAKVLEPELDAGAPARIRLDLQPHLGKIESRVVEVPIPAELAGREVEIELAPGYDVERPLPTPDSVAELVAMLPKLTYDVESIVATIKLRENGAAYRGKVASRLPPGAMDTLRTGTQSDAPEAFIAQAQVQIPLKGVLVGRDSVRVDVRPVLR